MRFSMLILMAVTALALSACNVLDAREPEDGALVDGDTSRIVDPPSGIQAIGFGYIVDCAVNYTLYSDGTLILVGGEESDSITVNEVVDITVSDVAVCYDVSLRDTDAGFILIYQRGAVEREFAYRSTRLDVLEGFGRLGTVVEGMIQR